MKKVIRSIATVALMFVVATSTANEPTLSVNPKAKKSLVFEMDAPMNATTVTITDIDGVIIFSEKVGNGVSYAKKFDLRKLPDGDYVLKVEDTLKETIFEFDIENANVLIADRKENAKPVFRKNGQKVLLNLLNTKKEDVKITIYDSEGRVVFAETLVDTFVIEKAFNFENAFKDSYTVIVANGKDTFYEGIVIK